MNEKLSVSPSPHIRSKNNTAKIMGFVILSLLPTAVMGSIYFGFRAALIIMVCILSAVIFEALFCIVTKKTQTIGDFSAVLTGLLLGLNLSPAVPMYIPIIGSFIAIVIVKMLFGGIGQNFANPAITARIILTLSFTGDMTRWILPYWYKETNKVYDAVTGATPLASPMLNDGEHFVLPFTFSEMFFGETGGCIGETCALTLIIGGVFLIFMKIISPTTPIAYVGTVAVLTLIYSGSLTFTLYSILGGGLLIGAFYMATDYSTTPISPKGKIVFGVGCGVITFVIRAFGGYPEGVSFSILLMNLLTPYIDKFFVVAPLGAKKLTKKEAK